MGFEPQRYPKPPQMPQFPKALVLVGVLIVVVVILLFISNPFVVIPSG